MSRIGVFKYEQSECFKLAIRDIFQVKNEFGLVFCRNRDRNGIFSMFLIFYPFFSAAYSFPQPKMSLKRPIITNIVLGKVEKENHIRKVQKSEERKVLRT